MENFSIKNILERELNLSANGYICEQTLNKIEKGVTLLYLIIIVFSFPLMYLLMVHYEVTNPISEVVYMLLFAIFIRLSPILFKLLSFYLIKKNMRKTDEKKGYSLYSITSYIYTDWRIFSNRTIHSK